VGTVLERAAEFRVFSVAWGVYPLPPYSIAKIFETKGLVYGGIDQVVNGF
jgi:hypothetical protein